jgi:hypothetical protein
LVQMATPWKHPTSGAYYLYRQIPKALRPAFGGIQHWKKSLGTKCPNEARSLYAVANADLERLMEAARLALQSEAERSRLTPEAAQVSVAKWRATVKDSSAQCFWAEEAAHGQGFAFQRSEMFTPNADDLDGKLDDDAKDKLKLRIVGEGWLDFITRHSEDDWLTPAEGALQEIHQSVDAAYPRTPFNDIAILRAFNVVVRDDVARSRESIDQPRRRRTGRLRPDMRVSELFAHWKSMRKPRAQTAIEAKAHVADLIDFLGDVKVATITREELYDYRDAASSLPSSMPSADRLLPFRERLDAHEAADTKKVSTGTLKKRIGSIATLLSFAVDQLWLAKSVATAIPIEGYTRGKSDRRAFRDGELKQLFESPLFLEPQNWKAKNAVSDCTLAWLFLIGLTTGARLEEMGKPALTNICQDLDVTIIDVDGLVKTLESRRIVPIHKLLLDLGFLKFIAALRKTGASSLFHDLIPNSLEKVTQEASRVANRYIDKHVVDDWRLVFYSQRHKFKDMARKANIIDSTIDRICGHAPVTPGGQYGDGVDSATLYREMMRIDYSMIDTDRLIAAWAGIDWDRIAHELTAQGKRS